MCAVVQLEWKIFDLLGRHYSRVVEASKGPSLVKVRCSGSCRAKCPVFGALCCMDEASLRSQLIAVQDRLAEQEQQNNWYSFSYSALGGCLE